MQIGSSHSNNRETEGGKKSEMRKIGWEGELHKSKSLWQNIDRCNEEVPVEDVNTAAHTLAEL